MRKIPNGLIGGHWSRHEKLHGRLNKAFPHNQFAQELRDGVKFRLTALPFQRRIPYSRTDEEHRQKRVLTVLNWRKRGICSPISLTKQQEHSAGRRHFHFILLFLVKKNGKKDYNQVDVDTIVKKWRGCLAATDLNEVLECGKFKQSNEPEIDANTPPGCYQCRSDVSDAYNQLSLSDLPINTHLFNLTSSQDLSCFNTRDPELVQDAVNRGWIQHPSQYVGDQMRCMWFGASPSPFTWQKTYALLLSLCRLKGASFSTVMDDNKLNDSHPLALSRSLLDMTLIHADMGVVMSAKEPEAAIPKQVEVFNGSLYDSRGAAKYKSQEKIDSIARSITLLLENHRENKRSTAKMMASALGKLADAARSMWGTKLFVDGLQADLTRTLEGARNYHAKGSLSEHTVQQLTFWLQEGHSQLNGRAMIHGHPVDQVLSTDWCSHGWGAVLEPTPQHPHPPTLSVPLPAKWHGVWSGWGETVVGMWAVMAFARQFSWQHMLICLRMDNVAAICYLNKMGSRIATLNTIMWTFVRFCKAQRLMVIASYIPGVLIKADAPSRRRATLWDCSLQDWVLNELQNRLCGGRQISFDLFATHMNTKAALFASLLPDPEATWVNCLAQSWHCNGATHLFYAFPPPNQTAQLLAKIKAEQQTVLLILPAWPRLEMAKLAKLLIALPIAFPMSTSTLEDPHITVKELSFVGQTQSPLRTIQPGWFLCGYLVSGKPCLLREGQRQLSKWSSNNATNLTPQWLTTPGDTGLSPARSCKWIQQLLRITKLDEQ
jgi:hypothetical protein